MNKADLTAKKRRWSSDNVVVIRRRPKPKPVCNSAKTRPKKYIKKSKAKINPANKAKSGRKKSAEFEKAKIIAPPPKSPPKPKWKNKRKPNFYDRVLKHMNKILPPQPFKIGIYKDLFEEMKDTYPGKRTKLRKAIKYYLKHKTVGRHYLKNLIIGEHRHGLNGGKYTIEKTHREYAKKLLIEKLKDQNG